MNKILDRLSHYIINFDNYIKRTPGISALVFSVIFFTIFFVVFVPRFNTNDDLAMMLTVNGFYYQEPSESLIDTNVIIGLILKFLYGIVPGICWYAFYLYCFHFIAFFIITYSFLLMKRDVIASMIFISAICFFEVEMLLNLQYTSTSLMLGFAGILFYLVQRQKNTIVIPLISSGLLGIAYLIRSESFYGTLVFSFPILLYALSKFNWKKKLIFILATLSILLSTSWLNNFYYGSNSAWQNYFKFNKIRGDLHSTYNLNNVDSKLISVLD